MDKKLTVGILFGGKSVEHEISLLSAKNICDAIDRRKFRPVLIGIDKDGRWRMYKESGFLVNSGDARTISLAQGGVPAALLPECGGALSVESETVHGFKDIFASETETAETLDVVFPILHGPYGEDGTVQGLLKIANVPFVGPGVTGSAVGMDKDVMKRLLHEAGIPIVKFLVVREHEKKPEYREICAALGSPFFIKPANTGSSVGISKAHNEVEYTAALKDAFLYDTKVIMEEYVAGRELECGVLGNEEPAASEVGEVITTHEFYSYDAKYLDENGAALEIPAKIDGAIKKQIQLMAVKTFQILGCEGISRVDFFLRDKEVIVNEINTMPGFTSISMYPKLWEASGVSYTDLITRLIELGISRYEKESRIKTKVGE